MKESKTYNTKDNNSLYKYDMALKILDDLSLDVFFSQNPIPTVEKYPSIETFKSGFVSMNEKLYKSLKERREEQYLRSVEHRNGGEPLKFEHNFKKNHLAVLDNKKVSKVLKEKLRRSAIKYCNSQAIIRLFKGYFILIDHHFSIRRTYPGILDQYLKTILRVFGSLKREKMGNLIREMSFSTKMYEFYKNLYNLWEHEANNLEKCFVFSKNSPSGL